MRRILRAGTRQQLVAIERAQEIVGGAEIEPLGQAGKLVWIGNKQDRHEAAGLVGAQLRDDAQGVGFAGHAEDHQIDGPVAAGEEFFRLARAHDLAGQRRQYLGDARAGESVLFPQENARRAGIFLPRLFLKERIEPATDIFAMTPFFHHAPQTNERAHAGKKRRVVDRFGEKVIDPRLETAQTVGGFGKRRHHDDRNVGGTRIGLQAPAGLEPVHSRHHHVEQDKIGMLLMRDLERGHAVAGAQYLIVFARELRLEDLHVHINVVNNEYARRHWLCSLG